MANIRQYIEDFQGDDDDYERLIRVFVKLRNFLKVIVKYNLQDEVDINHLRYEAIDDDPELWDFLYENGFLTKMNYAALEDEVKNSYLLWLLDKNPTECLNFIVNNLLLDVEIRDDGYWLKLNGREELAQYFSEGRGRDTSPRYIAEKVFSEDGLGYDWHFDSNINVFDDVIGNLNKVNLERLGKRIVEEIGNTKLSTFDYTSSFFKELSEKQGTENTFEITNENVMSLFINEKALNELLNGDLDELNSELVNLYWNAENSAYEDEIYRTVYDGLEEFFSSKIDEKPFKVGEKVRYIPYIRIKDFKYDVKVFLENQEGYYIHTLEYISSYTSMMGDLFYNGVFEQIDVSFPDYPDWTETKNMMNEFFDL